MGIMKEAKDGKGEYYFEKGAVLYHRYENPGCGCHCHLDCESGCWCNGGCKCYCDTWTITYADKSRQRISKEQAQNLITERTCPDCGKRKSPDYAICYECYQELVDN